MRAAAREELEDIKRRYLAGELTTEEARTLDRFWRRRAIGLDDAPPDS